MMVYTSPVQGAREADGMRDDATQRAARRNKHIEVSLRLGLSGVVYIIRVTDTMFYRFPKAYSIRPE